jgi:hypothetical protein
MARQIWKTATQTLPKVDWPNLPGISRRQSTLLSAVKVSYFPGNERRCANADCGQELPDGSWFSSYCRDCQQELDLAEWERLRSG